MSGKLPIIIYRFYTKYDDDPKNKGQKRALDMVEYGPIGSADRTKCVERIDILSRCRVDAGANPGVEQAQIVWGFIKPKYEAWKNNQELPTTGTPLAAWNHLTPEQAEVLRANGIKSIEDVAVLTDMHFQRIPIPNMRSLNEAAKLFLAAREDNLIADKLRAKDEEISALQMNAEAQNAKIDELAGMVAESMKARMPPSDALRRKRGRPRKIDQASEMLAT